MNKHTEGPWSTRPESQITGGTYEILTKDGQPVASVWPGALGADVVPANAHLIASAPELFEACKETVRILEDKEFPAPIAFTLIAYIKQMKDAIAKAEGRV